MPRLEDPPGLHPVRGAHTVPDRPLEFTQAYRKDTLLETFVETSRFRGTCYQAANWTYLGQTKGRGKLGPAGQQSLPIKDIWTYPLHPRFREILTR